MTHQPPSLARISLLLIGSAIAGTLVSALLATRLETRPDKTFPPPAQPLVAESP